MAETGGARFTKRHTRQQVDAYLTAVLIDGMAQTDAMRAAIAGELVPGLPPFGKRNGQGKLAFGYTILQTHGQDFIDRNPKAEAEDTREMLRLAQKANKAALRTFPADGDAQERVRLMKAVDEGARLLARAQPAPTPRTREDQAEPSDREAQTHSAEPNDTLAQLVDLATARDTPSETAYTTTSADDGAAGPVRSLAS